MNEGPKFDTFKEVQVIKMKLINKVGVVGAVLGAAMMFTGSAHAYAVNSIINPALPGAVVIGDGFSNNSVADDATTNLDGSDQSGLALSDELGYGSDGEFRFAFKNTNLGGQNILVTMAVTESYTPYVEGFTAVWKNNLNQPLGLPYLGLPVTSSGPISVVVAAGSLFYLVVTWNNVVDGGINGGGELPKLLFTLASKETADELTPVPVPPSLALFGTALLGMGFLTARRRRKSTSA